MKKFKNFTASLVLFVAAILMQSCSKDDPIIIDEKGVAPELPFIGSIAMSFGSFENVDTTNLSAGKSTSRNFTYSNWFYAATNLLYWSHIVSEINEIPLAAFMEAFNHEPVFKGNGIWLWAYEVIDEDDHYLVELTGSTLDKLVVQWDLYVEKVGGFSKMHWITGTTRTDIEQAEWTINGDPSDPKPMMLVNYEKDVAPGEARLRYTNVIEGDQDYGSYLEFQVLENSSTDLNRRYHVYEKVPDNLIEIEWHEANKNGRVKSANHFADNEWHCWDTNYKNQECN